MLHVLTYALLAVCGALVVFGFWVADKTEHPSLARWARYSVLIQLIGIGGAYWVVRPGASDDVAARQEAAAKDGKPLLMSFHSNYCGACLMAKPTLDRIESELSDEIEFARIDIMEEEKRALAQKFEIGAVPSFVLVDPNGGVLYRQVGGKPDREQIDDALSRWHRKHDSLARRD